MISSFLKFLIPFTLATKLNEFLASSYLSLECRNFGDSGRYTIEDAGINSKYSDYGSSFFQNKLVFTTARDTGSFGQKKHKWTNQYFTNLYTADLDENKIPISASITKFSKSINFHNGMSRNILKKPLLKLGTNLKLNKVKKLS